MRSRLTCVKEDDEIQGDGYRRYTGGHAHGSVSVPRRFNLTSISKSTEFVLQVGTIYIPVSQ